MSTTASSLTTSGDSRETPTESELASSGFRILKFKSCYPYEFLPVSQTIRLGFRASSKVLGQTWKWFESFRPTYFSSRTSKSRLKRVCWTTEEKNMSVVFLFDQNKCTERMYKRNCHFLVVLGIKLDFVRRRFCPTSSKPSGEKS